MLVLTRKKSETIRIGDEIIIKVVRTSTGSVKLGIEAPSSIPVVRGELTEVDLERHAGDSPSSRNDRRNDLPDRRRPSDSDSRGNIVA